MPIQFCCSQCGEPIEVDDEHAGQTAACPYCQHTVTVPLRSTYDPESAVAARPGRSAVDAHVESGAGEALGSVSADLGRLGRHDSRRRMATKLGNMALACAGLAVFLFLIYVIGATKYVAPITGNQASPAFDEQQIKDMQAVAGQHPWLLGSVCGSLFFALAGLALAIISLIQCRQGNWRALIGLSVCGGFFLCMCFGVVFQLVMFGMPGAT